MNAIILSGQGPSNRFLTRFAGPHRLATELRNNGFSTQIIMGLGYFSIDEMIKLLEHFVTSETLFVGISTTFFVDYSHPYAIFYSKLYSGNKILREMPELLSRIKDRFPNIKIVVGGPAVRNKIVDNSSVDLYIEGYGENALLEYAESLKKKKSVFYSEYFKNTPLVTNPKDENFDFHNCTIKFESNDCLFPGEAVPLELSRGCIFRCKFCSFPLRGRSIKDGSFIKNMDILYRELMENYQRWGTVNYSLVDDTFNDNQEKLRAIAAVLNRLPFKINFASYIRADLVYAYPESLQLLKEMGICGAFLGIESFNSVSRRLSAKGFNTDKLLEVIDSMNREWKNVIITSSFIYGLPGESAETANEWTDNILFKSGLFDKHDILVQPLFIDRNTKSFKSDFDMESEKYGYQFPNPESPWYWSSPTTNFNEMKELSAQAMKRAAQTFRPFLSHHIPILLGYGIPLEKTLSLDYHKPEDIDFVENLTIERYRQYYNMLMSV
jgi:hypothetical protein